MQKTKRILGHNIKLLSFTIAVSLSNFLLPSFTKQWYRYSLEEQISTSGNSYLAKSMICEEIICAINKITLIFLGYKSKKKTIGTSKSVFNCSRFLSRKEHGKQALSLWSSFTDQLFSKTWSARIKVEQFQSSLVHFHSDWLVWKSKTQKH